MRFYVLLITTGVALRDKSETPLNGYLSVVKEMDSNTLQFAFIPRNKLSASQIMALDELVTKTRYASTKSSFIQQDNILQIQELLAAAIDQIHVLALQNDLTVAPNGQSACLVKLIFELQMTDSNGEHLELPPVFFEKEGRRTLTVQDVENLLKTWMKCIGKSLLRLNGDENDISKKSYVIQDLTPEQILASKQNFLGFQVDRKWQVPDDSPAIMKLATGMGNFGYNVVANIIGKPITESVVDRIEDATWDVMETFSKVTQYSKEATAHVLEHPLARPILPLIPAQITSIFLDSAEVEELVNDYDSAGRYLHRWASDMISPGTAQTPPPVSIVLDYSRSFQVFERQYYVQSMKSSITEDEWNQMIIEQKDIKTVKEQLFWKDVSSSIRKSVWKFLLLRTNHKSTESRIIEYEGLKKQWETLMNEHLQVASPTLEPVATTSITNTNTMNTEPGTNETLSSPSTLVKNPENNVISQEKALRRGSEGAGDEKEELNVVSKIRERKYRVEKDVVRTDRQIPFYEGFESDLAVPPGDDDETVERLPLSTNLAMLRDILITYAFYDFELGYVQGMNDLLSPVLYVVGDEEEAFWCFVNWMQMMRGNFFRDQSGMRLKLKRLQQLLQFMDPYLYQHLESTDAINLFCCFRWLLVCFKREFSFDDIQILWESIWSCPLTLHFEMFIAFAILNEHRENLMKNCKAFDETLKYINDLSGKMNVTDIIRRAQILFYAFQFEFSQHVEKRMQIKVDLKKRWHPKFETVSENIDHHGQQQTNSTPTSGSNSVNNDFVMVHRDGEDDDTKKQLLEKTRNEMKEEDVLDLLSLLVKS